ncbi:LLM class flavin-dependent oxidoreductase [Nocardioides sp. BYT-33-1]|uniref:LLM class flavin-dependent oxidoreductase n=1 Tax=Nocardioides sp. BYT-33-1 TaxID=3416952 RepID=UPI003F537512
MDVGVFLGSQYAADEDIAGAVTGLIEQTKLIRDTGYDAIWLGQHFLSHPEQYLQTTPLLARLAAEAGEMNVGTNLLLLPMLNPVDVAEQYATMDVITGGRLILGVGLGYRAEEFAAMQLDKKDRVGRLVEGVEILKRLWTEDHVSFQGRHFTLDDVSIAPKPLQRPRPQIWFGATADKAIERAATHADAWIATSMTEWGEMKRQVDLYHRARADAGLAREVRFAKCVELYVGDDKESALREAEPFIGAKYKAYYSWGMGDNVPGESGANISDFGDLTKNRFIVGGPEDVIEDCLHHRDVLGVTDLIVRLNFPGMPKELVHRNIERFATEVIPHIR